LPNVLSPESLSDDIPTTAPPLPVCAAPDKKRPVVVLTRDSAIAYLSAVTVAPITSTIRGVPSEVVLGEEDGMAPCAVNLHNAVTISQQRLGRRVARLGLSRMSEICAALRFSLGCDSSRGSLP
jgi:mRNA interferase MazF